MTFSQPSAGGDQFDPKDHNGRLLIVYPKSFSAETPTIHGTGPSADVDIVVVDLIDPTTGAPTFFSNSRLFGNLAKSVSRDLGGQVLGRLGQVPTQRGNPAWVLQQFTDQDVAMATPADNAYRAGQFKQAENPMQQPAQAAPAATPQYQTPAPAAPAQQQWPQQAPAPAAAAPAQQWQGAPAGAPAAAPAQQWNPAPPAAPAAAPQAPPTAPPQQWQQPAAPAPTPAPQAAPAAPPAGPPADPGLVAHLATLGITLPPGTSHAEALAIYETLPQ